MTETDRLRLEREINRLRFELGEATRTLPHLRRMVADSADGLLLLDGDLAILEANPRAAALFGMGPTGFYGKPLWRWLADPQQARELEERLAALPPGDPLLLEVDLVGHEGGRTAVELLLRRLEGGTGSSACWTASLRDIGERRRLKTSEAMVALQDGLIRRLRDSEERYRLFVDQLGDGLALLDQGQHFRFANPAMSAILQREQADLDGCWLGDLVAPADRTAYDQLIGAVLAARPRRERLHCLTAAGGQRLLELEFRPRFDAEGVVLGSTLLARDVTDLTEARLELERLAFRDPLTGLPNQEDTLRFLRGWLAHHPGDPLAVLWLDLDGFGRVNHSFGRAAGDHLLQQVADHLRGWARSSDRLARFGGDEFLVLRPGADRVAAEAMAAELQASLVSVISLPPGDPLALRFCGGLSLHPDHGDSAEELLRHAATALSRAHDGGPGRVRVYDPAFTRRLREELDLESRLRRALADDALHLVYQPQVDREGRLIGNEALLRWHDESLGPVGPDRFVPVAERTGLIHSLGEWVLQQACRQQACWIQADLAPPPIAVNVSPLQFDTAGPSMTARVAAILDRHALDPLQLELEITETCILPITGLLKDLQGLAALGVRLAIDDFGTGFSSLTSLQRLPLHRLKIDRSFIAGLERRSPDRVLVRTALSMGRGLGLKTLAEGVETPGQRTILADMDCDAYQGYLFSRPLAVEAFTELLCRGGGLEPESP